MVEKEEEVLPQQPPIVHHPIDPIPSSLPFYSDPNAATTTMSGGSSLVMTKPMSHAPIYIDNAPPKVNVDPTLFAQQVAMLRTSAVAAHKSSRISSSPLDLSTPYTPSLWRCSWCLIQGQYTPTIRRGPLGLRTVCQSCGVEYERKGVLPFERYQSGSI